MFVLPRVNSFTMPNQTGFSAVHQFKRSPPVPPPSMENLSLADLRSLVQRHESANAEDLRKAAEKRSEGDRLIQKLGEVDEEARRLRSNQALGLSVIQELEYEISNRVASSNVSKRKRVSQTAN